MFNPFRNMAFEFLGAFVCWAIKGFNGNFDDELSRPGEVSIKSTRNILVSMVTVGLILFVYYLMT